MNKRFSCRGLHLNLWGPIMFFVVLAILLFRQWVFLGKLPIAADLQVGNYEPWKTDREKTIFKPLGFDDIRIFYPQRVITSEQIRSGIMPVWNPYEFSGNVLLANSQTSVFYPPSWLFLVLPAPLAWSLLAFFTSLLAALFMFLWLRTKLTFLASVFGASAFMLSGFMVVRIEDSVIVGQTALWLPLALYGIEQIVLRKLYKGIIIICLALMMSILAGWFQITFYVLGVTLLYALYRRIGLKVTLLIFGVSVLLTPYHWYPASQAFKYSPRGNFSSIDLRQHLMNIPHLMTYLVPDFFGNPANNSYFGKSEYKEGILFIGILPLIFSLFGFLNKTVRERLKPFLLLVIFCLPLGFNIPGVNELLQEIPLVSSFLPNRIFFIVTFSLCVAAAYGIDYSQTLDTKKTFSLLKSILLYLSICLGVVLLGITTIYINEKLLLKFTKFSFFSQGLERYVLITLNATRESLFVLLLTGLSLLISAKRKSLNLFLLLGFTIYLVFQIVFADRYLYFSNPKNLFPDHPVISYLKSNTKEDYSRVVSLGYAKFTSNTLSYYGLYDVDGVDAMYPTWYGELMGYVASNGKSISPQDRIATWFDPKISSKSDWLNPFTVNFFKLTGIRYIVFRRDFGSVPPPEKFRLAYTYRNWLVYEYMDSLPKAQFVFDYDIVADKRLHLKKLFDPYFSPKTTVELFDRVETPPISCGFGVAKTLTYLPNQIKIESNSTVAGFVVVNDSYFPNWRATVDGIGTKVFRANYAFRAVSVPAGKHVIDFSYSYL